MKETLVYDHFHNSITIIVLEEDHNEGKEQAEDRIEEIERMLKKDIS